MEGNDPRQGLVRLLREYLDRYPAESEMVERYLDFVEQYDDCFERSQLSGHVTGSALVYDSSCTHVLLTHHRKLDRWLQPGGHADGDTDVLRVAQKEADEETGLEQIAPVTTALLDVDIHGIPERKGEPAHFHYDCRFLLRSTGSDEFTVSEESHDLAWVEPTAITAYTDEESILRMLSKSKSLLTDAGLYSS